MPSYAVRNENFRDAVVLYAYPFDEVSTLEDDTIYLGTDLIVDASFFIKTEAELPLHISTVDGTYGDKKEVRLLISDASGVEVGRCTLGYDSEDVGVLNSDGIQVGILVFDPQGLSRFIGRVSGHTFGLLPSVASFSLDVCHVSETPHLRYIRVGNRAVSGDVSIIARHGCAFVVEDGKLRLDVFGDPEDITSNRPVVSVNGVRNQSIWLSSHPRANLRIDNSDGEIRFAQAGDETT